MEFLGGIEVQEVQNVFQISLGQCLKKSPGPLLFVVEAVQVQAPSRFHVAVTSGSFRLEAPGCVEV